MSQGKYSPNYPHPSSFDGFEFNCFGNVPAKWDMDVAKYTEYDQKTMFPGYDSEGFDSYGYSAFDVDGNYDFGSGVDRNGMTEQDYLVMDPDEFFAKYYQTDQRKFKMTNPIWITVTESEPGDVFEGTQVHWSNCFFSNATRVNISTAIEDGFFDETVTYDIREMTDEEVVRYPEIIAFETYLISQYGEA